MFEWASGDPVTYTDAWDHYQPGANIAYELIFSKKMNINQYNFFWQILIGMTNGLANVLL